MAFTTKFNVTLPQFGLGTEKNVYNFDHQVRTFAGGGDAIDVMLLQALFRMFFYELGELGKIPKPPATTGIIKVDGIVGPQTRIHIDHFQQFLLKRGLTATTDGVMDPFKKQGVSTPHTKKQFQLLILNGNCLAIATQNGVEEVHQRMIDDDVHGPGVYPNKLRAALRVPRALT
jgi:hypothetical protein